MQVQFLGLDVKVDSGLSPSTLQHVCVCVWEGGGEQRGKEVVALFSGLVMYEYRCVTV